MVSISHKKISSQKGFTLIETLVTLFIFGIIALGASTLFRTIFITSGQQNLAGSAIDQARLAIFTFTNELRNAAIGIDGSYSVNKADDAELVLYSTYSGGPATSTNRLRYYITGTTLYKGVTAQSGNPPTYNLANEVVKTVQTNLKNASTTPLFLYYNGSYGGTSTPLTQPVNINQIKYVKMNLVVLKQTERDATTTFSMIGGATIRNLKTNLGN